MHIQAWVAVQSTNPQGYFGLLSLSDQILVHHGLAVCQVMLTMPFLAGIGFQTSLFVLTRSVLCRMGKVVCVAAAQETILGVGQAYQSAHMSCQMAEALATDCRSCRSLQGESLMCYSNCSKRH